MALDGDAPDHVTLAAIRDALDRAGLGAKQAVAVDVTVQPYEEIMAKMTGIAQVSRAESRARRGLADEHPALAGAEVVDAEVVDDPDMRGPHPGSPPRGPEPSTPPGSLLRPPGSP